MLIRWKLIVPVGILVVAFAAQLFTARRPVV